MMLSELHSVPVANKAKHGDSFFVAASPPLSKAARVGGVRQNLNCRDF